MNETLAEGLHRRLYLALQRLRGRPVGRFIRQLQEWEKLDRAAFSRLANTRLQETLRFAQSRAPLYATGPWQAALSRSDPQNIQNWPVLERKMVVTHREQLLARGQPLGTFYRHSSASSGEPLRVAYSPAAAAWSWSNEYRAMLWYGVAPGAKTLMMWGSSHPVLDWIRNCKVFLTTELTQARLEEAAQYMIQERPTLFVGLPSAAARLARFVGITYPEVPRPVVPFVKLGGEQIYPFERDEVERHLGAKVVEFYGSTEMGAIAAQCPEGSRHVFAEHVHLEIHRDGQPVGPGEFGDIVLTSLDNRAMPLVRCRIGDRGRLSPDPCRCGRPHPVLAELVGRAADLFLGAEGSLVHGSVLGQGLQLFLSTAPPGAIGQVLFQQVGDRSWKVLVESPKRLDGALSTGLSDVVRTAMGKECQVEVEQVAVIPREASGKFRYYRSATNPIGAGKT
jgi:phenylacetate-CoA ligase